MFSKTFSNRKTASLPEKVKSQYELLPYPQRDPERELEQLQWNSLDDLSALNHFCFQGQLDISKPLRVLVAGGGTGDSTIQLGYQLENSPAELVHVDLSEKSIHIARERAKKRNFEQKINWVQRSLLELTPEEFGTFDYINCMGVLHHLEKPEEGLRVLTSLLKPTGAMGLMVYGSYGRTSIYQLQKMFELMGLKGETPTQENIAEARKLLLNLPDSNWHSHGKKWFASIEEIDDSELYDLFLHPCDQAYSVTGITKLLETSNLHLLNFSSETRFFYDAQTAFGQTAFWPAISQKPKAVQQELSEIHWGCLNKHAFWAAPQADRIVMETNPSHVPMWGKIARLANLSHSISQCPVANWSMDLELKKGIKVSLNLVLTPATKEFCRLVDGVKSVSQIIKQVRLDNPNLQSIPEQDIQQQVVQTIRLLSNYDLLLLRSSETVPFRVY